MMELNSTSFETARHHCRNVARGLLLLSLLYVTWRFGGVDAVTLVHVSMLMIATCVLAMIGQPKFGFRAKPLPGLLLSIVAISVAWPIIQSVQFPQAVFNAVATGQHEINQNLVESTFETTFPILRPSLEASMESVPESRTPRRSISVVSALTDVRINQWALMGAYVFLSALLFDTRKSRNLFLWTLAVNTGFLATWGLIQRATGSTDLLPGTTRSIVLMPFGPFIYKNAGAAALVPGFAAAIALLWPHWLPRYGTKRSTEPKNKLANNRKKEFEYRNDGPSDAMRSRFLLTLVGLAAAGLMMSYSRGAWLGAIVAIIVTLISVRRYVPKRVAALIVGVPILACLAVITLPRGVNPLVDRIDGKLSANYVYADARWEHWKEGFRSAKKYFPLGSGLGTYGYATLAEQRSDSRLWFREAHNHYLETLAEQGIPGLLILILGGLCVTKYGYALITNQVSRERRAIGVAGIAALVAIAVQSLVDFVILIPAVMFLFASLFGIVAQAYAMPIRKQSVRTVGQQKHSSARRSDSQILPVICLVPVLACLVVTHFGLRDRLSVEQSMAETRPDDDAVPDDLIIDANLDRLNESIARYSNRSELRQRRAYWHTMKLRVGLRRASMQAGNEMSWESTSPIRLFQILMTLPESEKSLIADEFSIDSTLREPLRSALTDLQSAIDLNPFVPQIHRELALLAPTVAMDPFTFHSGLCRLAHSDPRSQFVAGLIAHFIGKRELMLDQWRRSLRGTCPEFPQMVRLCSQTMSAEEIADTLVPHDRAILLLPMLRSLGKHQLKALVGDTRIFRVVEQKVTADPTLPVARRHALLAWIAIELERHKMATKHWGIAVAADRDNVDYRYEYCRSLLRGDKYEEIFRQCSLGQSLEPDGKRFRKMADSARLDMKSREL